MLLVRRRERPMLTDATVQVREKPSDAPVCFGSDQKQFQGEQWRDAFEAWNVGGIGLPRGQHHVRRFSQRLGQRLVLCRITRFTKEGVENHQGTAIGGKALQEFGVLAPIPVLSVLSKYFMSLVIHQNENDFVSDGTGTEPKEVIVTG